MSDNVYALLQKAWSVSKTSDASLFGVEIAIVTNTRDPEKQGRVKICFPRLPGKPESDWARVAQPAAGPGRGFYWLPEVNDEVMVAFERGQTNHPYVLGALWNGKDKPMKDAYTDDNTTRMIQTKSGHQIVLSDKDGEEKITIADGSGKRTITFDVKNKKFLIEAKEGDVELHAKKKMVLQCEDIEIKTRKTGKLEIGSTFDLKVAQKAGFKAGPKFVLKATKVNLNPPSLTLEALEAAVIGAIAGAVAGAAAGGAEGAAAGAAAGAQAGFDSALGGGPGGGLIPTRDAVEAAQAGAAAGADAGQKAGAGGVQGTEWTKAKEGQAGSSSGAAQGGAQGGKDAGAAGGEQAGTGGGEAAGGEAEGGKDAGAQAAPAAGDVSVTLQDSSGSPASGVAWQVTLPDGTVKTGTTGGDGKIFVKGAGQPGQYKLVLPDLDKGAPSGDGGAPPSGDASGGDASARGDEAPPSGKDTPPAPEGDTGGDTSSQGDTGADTSGKDDAAPADDEEKRYLWVKGIIEGTDVKNWKTGDVLGKGKFDTGSMKMNVLALRGWVDGQGKVANVQNKFNDTFYVAYVDGDGKKRCEAFLATTDPGHVSDTDVNPLGMAHLLDNQYRFKRGRHHSKRNAMNQAEPFQVWRSKDQHGDRKGDEAVYTGWFGINNHDAMQKGTSVGNSSEGCQVVWGNYTTPEVCRYFWLMGQDPEGVVKYTLRDAAEVGDAAYASLKPGYAETKARSPRMKDQNDPGWKQSDAWFKHFFSDSGPTEDK